MFTGIVEALGTVVEVVADKTNLHFRLGCPFTHELKIDQSVAHDGVCLTVTQIETDHYWVTAIAETLAKTNLRHWKQGTTVNLERCLAANGRFDGHIVQGHVDQIATCIHAEETGGSWKYAFRYDPAMGNLTVAKGSICVNGVSLTVVDSGTDSFSVAVIPYTHQHTNFSTLQPNSVVNLEFDIVGKYIRKMLANQAVR